MVGKWLTLMLMLTLPGSACGQEDAACANAYQENCMHLACCDNSHMCYKRADAQRSHYGQCRPAPAEEECMDTEDWLCPSTWRTLPSPAAPETAAPEIAAPGSEANESAATETALISPPDTEESDHRTCKKGAPAFGDCLQEKQCCQRSFECFKKTRLEYAQCRPVRGTALESVGPTNCTHERTAFGAAEWRCQDAWAKCADTYGDCTMSKCCRHRSFGCFKRTDRDFAQCLPLDRSCGSHDDWLCPGSWEECADEGEECTTSKCCAQTSLTCMKRPDRDYAQCRPHDTRVCNRADEWLCDWEACGDPWKDCTESECCNRRDFGCFRSATSNKATCRRRQTDCRDTEDYLCPGSWKHCSASSEDCSLTKCCKSSGFGCFKLNGDTFRSPQQGQCRSLEEPCGDDMEWNCPSAWQSCSGMYEQCYDTKCCADLGFGCFKKAHQALAMCRKLPTEKECTSDDEWLCPNTWERCAEDYDDCYASQCCNSESFGCYKKRNSDRVARCRELPKLTECTNTSQWLCPGWERCSGQQQSCMLTRCCMDPDFSCYKKDENHAQCLPNGKCQLEWGGDALCAVLGLEQPEPPPPPPSPQPPPPPPPPPPPFVIPPIQPKAVTMKELKSLQHASEGPLVAILVVAAILIIGLSILVLMLWKHLKANEARYDKVLGGSAEMSISQLSSKKTRTSSAPSIEQPAEQDDAGSAPSTV